MSLSCDLATRLFRRAWASLLGPAFVGPRMRSDNHPQLNRGTEPRPACARDVLQHDCTAQAVDNALDDRQPKARAFSRRAAAAEERFENFLYVAGGDAGARILDLQDRHIALSVDPDIRQARVRPAQ